VGAIQGHLAALVRKGYLHCHARQSRGYRLHKALKCCPHCGKRL
jgi:hypothetical protein